MKFKKILTLFMAMMLLASCIAVPALAAEEAAITYPWTAKDDFKSYTATSGGTALSTYVYSEGTQYGVGFSTKWSEDITKDGVVTGDYKLYKPATSDARVMLGTVKNTLYRKLENSIDFSETGRRYVFSFMLSSSQWGGDVSYLLGSENLYFGFKLDTTKDSKREVKPMLVVGSESVTKSTGEYFVALKNSVNETKYVVELTVDLREGPDSLKVKHYKENGSSAVYDIEKEVELSSYGKMEYIGLKATTSSTGVWSVSAAGYDTSAHEDIRTRIVNKIPSYEAYLDLEAQGKDFTFYDECKAMFESYGVAYESFESYVSSSNTELSDSGYLISDVEGWSANGLNGGIGWNSFWANGSTGTNKCNSEYAKIAYTDESSKTTRALAHNQLTAKPMYRVLKTPIDLSKDGEYYIKVVSRPSMGTTSSALDDYDFRFYVGDNIYFGTTYSADSDAAYKFPLNLSVVSADEAYQIDMKSRAETTLYYNYVLKIESKESGKDKLSLKMWYVKNAEPVEYNLTTEVDSAESINFIRLYNGNGSNIKFSDIAIESYTGERFTGLSAATAAVAAYRESISKQTSDAVLAAVDAVQLGLAKNILINEVNAINPIAGLTSGVFTKADGSATSEISGSLMFKYAMTSTGSKNVTAYIAIYEGDTLKAVLPETISLVAGTNTGSFGFDGETNVLPQASAGKTLTARAFVWDDGLYPITKAIPLTK